MNNQRDELLKMQHGLTDEEVEVARRWWNELPDHDKSEASMAILFAMYGRYILVGR